MFRCRPLAVAVFALWTLVVWGNRINNIVNLDGGDGVDLARAIGFVAIGLAVAVVVAVPVAADRARRVVTFAGWASIVLWATRIVTIPMGDYSAGFIAVHLVLATVSIGLARWAVVSMRAEAESTESTDRPSPGPDAAGLTEPAAGSITQH